MAGCYGLPCQADSGNLVHQGELVLNHRLGKYGFAQRKPGAADLYGRQLNVTVLGGIRLTGLDRLKVTLKLIQTDNKNNAFRHGLDLYNSVQTEQLIEKASESLDVPANELSQVT